MIPERKRVLIVDDDADVMASLSSFLEAHGYSVLKAFDGQQGLTLAKREQPDLIIMDIMLNERTEGFFTIQQLRRTVALESVPIFVLTALYSKTADFPISPDSGWLRHDEFFSKPVPLEKLLESIHRRIGAGTPTDQASARPEPLK